MAAGLCCIPQPGKGKLQGGTERQKDLRQMLLCSALPPPSKLSILKQAVGLIWHEQ